MAAYEALSSRTIVRRLAGSLKRRGVISKPDLGDQYMAVRLLTSLSQNDQNAYPKMPIHARRLDSAVHKTILKS